MKYNSINDSNNKYNSKSNDSNNNNCKIVPSIIYPTILYL